MKEVNLPELTLRGMLLGAVLTIIFTASNVYLGLKVGLTFSSAIPAAVISMAILRMYKDSNILENNMVQTQTSAAGTLSAIIFIIPGMLMIGYWQDFEFWQTLVVCACGGCLGVLFTIPLRRAMVVHSDLPYPEGVAAAEILKVGSSEDKSAGGLKEIATGGIFASIVSFLTSGLYVLGSSLSAWFHVGRGMTQFPIGYSTALVGAGYLVGITSGLAMLVGILIAWAGFVPYFTITGTPADGQAVQEFAEEVYYGRVRLIGAGAMGVAAIWTVITLAKPVIDGVKESLASINSTAAENHRTDSDMSMKSIGLVFLITLVALLGVFYSFVSPENLPMNQTLTFVVVGVLVAVLTGFFVAAACAYMAGLIGSSSSPISGIGILAIIISSLIIYAVSTSFGIFALPGGEKFATAVAIFVTSIILAIACISNDNMQDLKTGFLVGATPWKQQVALIIGCIVGAFVISPVLNLLYEAYGFPGALPRPDMDPSLALAAPQASLMTTIAQGIFSSQLEWQYIFMGIGLGICLVIINVFLTSNTKYALPPLAVGMGIYLPPSVQTPLVIGAIMGYFIDKTLAARNLNEQSIENHKRRGTLFASGLIVGESLMGVLLAGIIVVSVTNGGNETPLKIVSDEFLAGSMPEILGFIAFVAIVGYFYNLVVAGSEKNAG